MDLSISALNYQRGIKNGDFTVEEFISKSLERIESVDKNLHAFLKLNDSALENAKEIDRKIKSNQNVGKCLGMPISVKDNICIAGSRTTCGSISCYTDIVFHRYRHAKTFSNILI